MGAAWAAWLHFEVHPDSPLHQFSVDDVLNGAGVGIAPGPVPSTSDAALPLPTLRLHDHGPLVEHLQQVLSFWQFYRSKVDGDFGSRTKEAVEAWQRALQRLNCGRPDGVYGPRTHAAAAASYAALQRLQAT